MAVFRHCCSQLMVLVQNLPGYDCKQLWRAIMGMSDRHQGAWVLEVQDRETKKIFVGTSGM